MRLIDENSLAALDGSRPADTLTVWAWRDGSLVLPEPLQVLDWAHEEDAGDSVKVGQKFNLTIADPEGVLGAWRFDDPLAVNGTRIQVIYRVGGAGAVNLGWFRIVGNEPMQKVQTRIIREYGYDEPDAVLGPNKRKVFIPAGVVKIEAVDLTFDVGRDRFDAPESPAEGATALGEFRRLTADHFPTTIDAGVPDVPVSRLLVFDRERLDACQDLLSRVSARYRMGGDGECHVYVRGASPVWRADPDVSLVSVSHKQAVDRLYNRWVVEGKDKESGNPIRAVVTLDAGPLKHGGSHKREPYFYTSEMISTYQQALDHALSLRTKFLASLAVLLTVEIAPHPELQAGDFIEVCAPVKAGHLAYFPGEIASIRRGGDPSPGVTKLTVLCSYADLDGALDRTEWAKFLTGAMPELTWGTAPSNWGRLPATTWAEL